MEKEIRRPLQHETAAYYTLYIDQVEGSNYMRTLKSNLKSTVEFLQQLSDEEWNSRYAPEKWSIKEVVLHMVDSERIFAYRALRIARNDITPLAGFDQDAYVPHSNASDRSGASLIDEYQMVRHATLAMFQNFTDEMMTRMGTASDNPFSTLALAFIIAGHENHHISILKDRYLAKS
ncbi:MAG: DinB family protein [Saprospiraceae bacterium]|nr:DinB family protein [Saprospiraceae bacterium]